MDYNFPHRRYNPLTGEWVLVSPHRTQRPWQGQVEKTPPENLHPYDPNCYLCPGNSRAGGHRNPEYSSTFVFDNDFAALLPDIPPGGAGPGEGTDSGLFTTSPVRGINRVVCFSPRHDLSLPLLSDGEIEKVISTWREQTLELSELPFIKYVQIFENKGEMMGCSNPHPHSQIWASNHIPNQPALELEHQLDYLNRHGSCLLCDYLRAEEESGERLVAENGHFLAMVPFWAIWPFEVMLISRRHTHSLPSLTQVENSALAQILKRLTTRYDNLFEVPFPYSMGLHQAPSDGREHPSWHFHAHFYPPLLRSATVRKFMVGYEMLGMPQRDLTPEAAAARLRDQSEVHYRSR
jgi:UDPglucose--hexose-1-phosphate uridylyltransferase